MDCMGVVVTKNVNIKDVNKKKLQQVLVAFFFLLFLISHHRL